MRLLRRCSAWSCRLALGGAAGAAMQALTRNPLATWPARHQRRLSPRWPPLLALLGVTDVADHLWFAPLGAAVVTVVGYLVGGGPAATPTRLALAGAALNATLFSYVNAVLLLDAATLERLRFWTVGSLADARTGTVARILPFVGAGLLLALLVVRPLGALTLGDDAARGLGARPATIRAVVIVAVTLLCGAATAACGPIVFVGLLVPHLVRALTGPDPRWLLPGCALLAPGARCCCSAVTCSAGCWPAR
ncbi:iron chelate uptake ABC transporter family permease subunit [Micromonospora sp. R77]|nr:iron chelate uptake ABC transporter family permease subunit [Micromonospora sp. R77]MCI4066699.1 iron chelate uptake ABC transporter family permease subunit [Micromonospora sp. R77]